MKLIAQGLVGIALLAAVPAAGAVFHADAWRGEGGTTEKIVAAVPLHRTDREWPETVDAKEQDKGELLVQLAQASHRPTWPFPPPPPEPGFGPPPPFTGLPDTAAPFMPFGAHSIGFGVRPPMIRAACEDKLDREVALAGYFKSKLRLLPNQKEAWQKMEEAGEPAIEKLHAACEQLPVEMSALPTPPEAIDFAERQLSASAELLQALREPMRAFYDTLSSDQRRVLQPPDPPPM